MSLVNDPKYDILNYLEDFRRDPSLPSPDKDACLWCGNGSLTASKYRDRRAAFWEMMIAKQIAYVTSSGGIGITALGGQYLQNAWATRRMRCKQCGSPRGSWGCWTGRCTTPS